MKRDPAKAPAPSPEEQLAGFIDKFTPELAALIRAVRKKLRARLRGTLELVYDNYNFFVIGYSPDERPSSAIFSIAAQAKGVSLCFLQGKGLPDPEGLLRGSGNLVRNLPVESAAALDRPAVSALIDAALKAAKTRVDPRTPHQLIIRSVSAKQRPRRQAR